MSESSGILYEDHSYCLPCWADSKDRLPASPSSLFNSHDGAREFHEKKVSLKKYHHSRMKQSELKLPINSPIVLENYSKTTRVFETATSENKIGWSPIKFTFVHDRPSPHDQRYSHQLPPTAESLYSENKNIKSVLYQQESKVMAKTTKLERIMPTKTDELKKTKKGVPFHKIVNLSDLKESVCSFTENQRQEEKLEESQILMDYFHPTEKRMSEIEQYMKSKELGLSESTRPQ